MALERINERELVLSKHLFTMRYRNQAALVNRNNGVAIHATVDLIHFLENFKNPTTLEEARNNFIIDDLDGKIEYLFDKEFLLAIDYDEEIAYLKNSMLSVDKKQVYTENFIIYHSEDVIYPIPYFGDLLEEVYASIIEKGLKRFSKRSIVFICNKYEEYERLWGKEKIPSGVDYFVTHGRIIAVKPDQIYSLAITSESIFRAMTHELIHIFLFENYTNIPIWCAEGLCEYYSNNSYNISFKKLMEKKRLHRFSEIDENIEHSILDLDPSKVENNIAYRQSLSFIKYLADLFGEDKLMKCILKTGLSQGLKEIFKEMFLKSLDYYEDEWRNTFGIE